MKVLIVDDEVEELRSFQERITGYLESMKHFASSMPEIEIEHSAAVVCKRLREQHDRWPDIIISDVFMPQPQSGGILIYETLAELRKELGDGMDVKLVLMSKRMPEAMSFLVAPLREQVALKRPWMIKLSKSDTVGGASPGVLMRHSMWLHAIAKAVRTVKAEDWMGWWMTGTLASLAGPSSHLDEVKVAVDRLKDDYLVAVCGETGTGKEIVAQALHVHSCRAAAPYKTVTIGEHFEVETFGVVGSTFANSKAKRGLLELTGAGTLFIDEVEPASVARHETDLRRLLDEEKREYRPRGWDGDMRRFGGSIVLGSSSLEKMLSEPGLLSADLRGRIKGEIRLLALRERPEDIRYLANRFFTEAAESSDRSLEPLSDPVLNALQTYSWPGNVRELKHIMETLATETTTRAATLDDLRRCFRAESTGSEPPGPGAAPDFTSDVDARVRAALELCRGNRQRAGRHVWPDENPDTVRARIRTWLKNHPDDAARWPKNPHNRLG